MSLPATETVQSGPIVKWAGGKSRLLPELVSRTPKRFGWYFEPFFGGGALFFRLLPERACVSDVNQDLVNAYWAMVWATETLMRLLEMHSALHSTTYYYSIRERWNTRTEPPTWQAAAFIYLNKTCYNGLYRVNKRNAFNVPIGRYAAPQIYDASQLCAASRALQKARLRCCPYVDAVVDAQQGDFVYFDPPYVPISKTARFTSYTAQGFTESDQCMLAKHVQELTERGVHVMLSNSDTPLIRGLYRDFRIDTVKAPRAINSRANGRSSVDEVIITNGYL